MKSVYANNYEKIKLSKYLVFLAMIYVVVTVVPAVLLYRLIFIKGAYYHEREQRIL